MRRHSPGIAAPAQSVGAVAPQMRLAVHAARALNLALMLGLAVVLAACASSTGTPGGPGTAASAPAVSPSASTSSSAGPSDTALVVPDSPVAGIIASIDSAGLDQVRGFRLRTADGQVLPFVIGILENGAEFPPGHLAEHFATASPILVYFRAQGGQLVVYRIEDAG